MINPLKKLLSSVVEEKEEKPKGQAKIVDLEEGDPFKEFESNDTPNQQSYTDQADPA